MIPRGLKKKAPTSPPKLNNKKKSKSKSKSKQKTKRTQAQDFLQAFIDLQNTNCSTNRKKKTTTRDISSALTVATPALQKTISASKIRSKSSFSQYRKKCTTNAKQPLKINLCDVITEEDNVQYTEKTARSSYQEEENKKNNINVQKEINRRKLNPNTCAIKIQRAWRNYQTYKMVHKVYLREKKAREEGNTHFLAPQVHIKLKKSDLDKTLKIKKQHLSKKQGRKQQQLSQTQKIIIERFKENTLGSSKCDQRLSPIQYFGESSEEMYIKSHSNEEDSIIQKIKERQAERFNQVIMLIEKQSKNKSKEELLNELIMKFEQNKSKIENQMNKHLQYIEFNDTNSDNEPMSISNQQFNKYSERESYENINIKDYQSDSSMCFEYDSMGEDLGEFKIFDQRLRIIKEEKIRKLEKIDSDLLQYKLSSQEAVRKKELIYAKFDREIKEVEKNKKQFLFSLTQLKKNALKCQKSQFISNRSLSELKKSFSAGNTVLKTVLKQIKIRQLQCRVQEQSSISSESPRNIFHKVQTEVLKPLTNTPIISLSSPKSQKSSRSQKQYTEEKLVDKSNTQVMKQYSQDIQQLIQKELIDQFVRSAFLQERLFTYFRPYIEEIYQFTKVCDKEILSFMRTIQQYLPQQNIMLRRVNQKINPTSLQILRIIRDLEYEIDEYQLIIPEECFKKYRASIEKSYEEINSKSKADRDLISAKINDKDLVEKIYSIELEKKEKIKKYRNFERDLKIMYMKSVFNCINEFFIQSKSSNVFMNARSSIGPGQLTLAIKQYNEIYDLNSYQKLISQVQRKIQNIVAHKFSIPSFQNYHDIELFQRQVMKQIQIESIQNEFKWVNYMDEVLEIWQDLSISIVDTIIEEFCIDILSFFK